MIEIDSSARFREVARRSAGLVVPSSRPLVRGGGGASMAGFAHGSNVNGSIGNAPSRTLYQRYEQYGMFQSTPFSAIRLLANRMARPNIKVALLAPDGEKWHASQREKSRFQLKSLQEQTQRLKPIASHAILDALNDPNPFMLSYQLKLVTFMGLEIFGDYYWWIEAIDTPKGMRYRIWPVPPHWLKESYNRDGSINNRYWKIQPPGAFDGVNVPAESVVMFRYPDPFDPFGILSPMQALARPISIDAAGELAIEAQMRNGANPGLAIITGRPSEFLGVTGMGEGQIALTGDQREELMAWFRERYQGFMRAGEPLILDGLIKDVKQLNSMLSSLDNSQMAAYNEGKIYKGFAVNRISMGDVEAANRATAAVADEHLVVNALEPRTTMLNQTLTKYLGRYMADDRGPVAVYQDVSVIRDEELDLRRQTEMLDRGVMSRNEVRAEQGLQPIQGGDEIFLHDSAQGGGGQWVPVRVRDDEDRPDDLQSADDTGGADDAEFVSERPSGLKRNGRRRPYSGGRYDYDDGPRPAWNPAYGSNEKPSESAWHAWLKKRADRADKVRIRIEKTLRAKMRAWLRGKFLEARKVFRAAKSGDSGVTLVNRAWRAAEWKDELAAFLKETAEAAAQASVEFEWRNYRSSKSLDLQLKEAASDAGILAKIVGDAEKAAVKIAGQIANVATRVWNWLKRQFKRVEAGIAKDREDAGTTQSRDQPTPAQEAAKVIADDVLTQKEADDLADKRSGDGSTTIFNEGRSRVINVLAKAGRVEYEVWLTRRDVLVRDTHEECEGQKRTPGGKFIVGGHVCDYPGDPVLPAGERCGCRCSTAVIYR